RGCRSRTPARSLKNAKSQNYGYYFDEVAGKKIKYFEALGVGVPGAGPETPEDVQEEPEAETLLGTDIEI
ncbi:hypothetical protein, partial [Parasutterella excrementihominis]|uniref:hypothetical protein n=1 Tax=Parasutterella excrementihominis TaxID=487175 RepID=UPI002665AAA3